MHTFNGIVQTVIAGKRRADGSVGSPMAKVRFGGDDAFTSRIFLDEYQAAHLRTGDEISIKDAVLRGSGGRDGKPYYININPSERGASLNIAVLSTGNDVNSFGTINKGDASTLKLPDGVERKAQTPAAAPAPVQDNSDAELVEATAENPF